MNIIGSPLRILTTSLDKTIKLWDTRGNLHGYLQSTESPSDASSWRSKKWNLDIDIDARKAAELQRGQDALEGILAIESNQLARVDDTFAGRLHIDATNRRGTTIALQRSEKRRHTLSGVVFENGHISRPNSRQGLKSKMLGKITATPNFDAMRRYDQRKRVLGQLKGKETWVLSQVEIAHNRVVRREKRKRAKALRKLRREAKKSSSDPLADLLADEPVAGGDKLPAINIPPIKMDAADPENWAMGSRNREKQMYENHFQEKRRLELKESMSDARIRVATMPSDFLVRELGITAHDTNHDLVAEMRPISAAHSKKGAPGNPRRARMRSGRKGGQKG